MTATETIDTLRNAAQALEDAQREPALEPQEVTIAEAFRRLRTVGLSGYVSIGTGAIDSFRPGEFSWGEWTVYDGAKHFPGKTLLAALTACLDAHRPAEAEPLAVVQAALDSCEAKPF